MTQLATYVEDERPVSDEGIIVARHLVKSYGDFRAVAGISFSVRRGECFGLLGPNGAGKTTTIKMITCVSPVTSGELTVDGMDVARKPRQIKQVLGVVPQEDNLDPELTVRQNLRAYSRYFDMPKQVAEPRIDEALDLFQLTDRQHDRLDELSGGFKRRLTIARGLLNEPQILVLDEPTTGLDPQTRHLVWQKLRYLRAHGVTMLLTTHNMDEAAHLCDRLIIIDEGRIIEQGAPDSLIESHAGREVVEIHVRDSDSAPAIQELLHRYGVNVERFDDILYVFLGSNEEFDTRDIEERAERVVYRRANLEDVFLKLTGRGLAGE
jgi:lipooligosaccharide transport system ATP-binding protein